jgi:hypothetical protein
MLQRIELFVFVLSIIYSLKHIVQIIIETSKDDPTPLSIGKVEKVLLYLAMSYIITSIITVITT